jgi:hypothetical protein
MKKIALFTWAISLISASVGMAATVAPKYMQGNYADPQTPGTAVTVPSTAAQTAGNLNVVIVGWNDATAQVKSVTDKKGNVYQLAAGPTVLKSSVSSFSQAIYYANNILAAAAGTNPVTVTFNTNADYPDIRVMEYSGIAKSNPVDVVVGATGNSAMSSSGAVKTTNASDLLIGANMVYTSASGSGSGYVQRILSSPDHDLVEDQFVTTTGSYSATAPLNSAGPWVMQMVAFRVNVSATPAATPAPTPTPTPKPTAYIQGNYAAPQSTVTPVTVPYTAAQKAGDLNVVVVGWNNSTTQVSSVTDKNGNSYKLAAGPTVLTGSVPFSQAIYYAKNILAGANSVTVKFNAGAPYPDVRIMEYSGIDTNSPVDVAVGTTGSSATSNSGAVTTTNSSDLLVGANYVWTSNAGTGAGFTQRILTNPNSDLVEDRLVTAKGSYSASSTLSNAGPWVMQMVAFRATGSSAPTATPTPVPTPTPNPTPVKSPTPTPTPVKSPTPTPVATPPPTTATPAPTPSGSGSLGIIPSSRLATWYGNVGVPGGIPNRTTIFANVTQSPYKADNTGKTDASAAINNAIAACPSGQVVYLPAGTYKLSQPISFGFANGITLRGAGNSTVLVPDPGLSAYQLISLGADTLNWGTTGTKPYTNQVNWTAGYAQGSNVITLSSTANYKVGQLIYLTQTDDPTLVWTDSSSTQNIKQITRITAINGNNVTISPALFWTQWKASLSPIAQNFGSLSYQASLCGLESFKIDMSGTSSITTAIFIEQCYACWMTNIFINKSRNEAVVVEQSCNLQFNRDTIWDAQLYAENCGGLMFYNAVSSSLIEDNIVYKNFPGMEINGGSSGNAFLYNVMIDDYCSEAPNLQGYAFDGNHAAHNCMNLWEGNYGANFINDGYHGSGSHFTIFRNRFHGTNEEGLTENSKCVDLDKWSLYNNVVGNVLGTTGFSNVYDERGLNYSDNDRLILRFGYPNMGNGDYTSTRPYSTDEVNALDLAVRPTSETNNGQVGTTIVTGNWDSVHNMIVWDPTIANHTLPNSYYYPSKPAYFNSLTWPPFDPTNPGAASVNSIPAGYRYTHGTDPQ